MPYESVRAIRLLAVNHTGLQSGAEVVLLRVLGGALARGWEVRAAAPHGPLTRGLTASDIATVRLPELKLPRGPRAIAALVVAARSLVAAARLRYESRRCDVVLVNGLLALPAARLAKAAGMRKPVVWLVHDIIRRRDWLALLAASRSVIGVAIAPSEAAAQPLRQRRIPVQVVRNGTPWPVAPCRPRRSPGPVVIGTAALLTFGKGQDVLLEALARIPRRDVVVELVGGRFPKDGLFVEQLRKRADEDDLVNRVRFVGKVDDPLERMRDWQIAVLASRGPESAPLAVLEAMSIGLPVVATNDGGGPEVLDGAGLLVPPEDADALGAAILRLLDDPDLRSRCGAAGRAAVAAGLTLDAQTNALLDLLYAVASGR